MHSTFPLPLVAGTIVSLVCIIFFLGVLSSMKADSEKNGRKASIRSEHLWSIINIIFLLKFHYLNYKRQLFEPSKPDCLNLLMDLNIYVPS